MAVKKLRKLSGDSEIGFSQLLEYANSNGFEETIAVRLWRVLLSQAMNPPHPKADYPHDEIRAFLVPLHAIRHAATQPRSTYRTYGPLAKELLQGWAKTL